VVLGALAGGVMAEKVLETKAGFYWWVILALSVWIIYTFDHLLDAIKIKDRTLAGRRVFYYNNLKILFVVLFIVGLADVYLSLRFFSSRVIFYGGLLGLITALYFLLIHLIDNQKLFLFQKEIIVALIYTAGIYLVPVLTSPEMINTQQILIIISFFLLVWSDILLIAVFERKDDLHDGFASFPVIFGIQKTDRLIQRLVKAVFVLQIFTIAFFPYKNIYFVANLLLVAIGLGQLLIWNKRLYLQKNNRYRLLTEFVFYLPALMFFV